MTESVARISTEALARKLPTRDLQVIDVRPVDAYNGWRLRGEPRGGHISGARTLPEKWSEYLDWIEIVRSKEILPEHALVVYGYDVEEAERVARLFGKVGYGDVRIYDGFLEEWSRDEDLPMDRLPRYRHLVPASWLKQLLEEGRAPEWNGKELVLCHTHYRNPEDYREGHIPGAVPLDTLQLESPDTWNRRSPEEVKAALAELGIRRDTTVVLYGRFSAPKNEDPFPGSSAGQLAAFRCAFIMLWAGVEDVRVLNGGLQSWLDAGYDTTTREARPTPVDEFGAHVPGRPDLAVDLPEAKAILADPDRNLVSVRSWPEYVGEVSGYNYIEKKGRIPGSVFGDCGTDAYHMENYRNLDHTVREFREVEGALRDVGVTSSKHNAFYCGTGWRGSEAFFNAWLLGWPRVSVYDGGWFEWSRDETNPVATGVPE